MRGHRLREKKEGRGVWRGMLVVVCPNSHAARVNYVGIHAPWSLANLNVEFLLPLLKLVVESSIIEVWAILFCLLLLLL